MSKKILLGVTGSIAVYKSLFLVRLLVKEGHDVKVIMTPSAAQFVSPISFSTLSRNEVVTDIIDHDNWNNHVALGAWADLMLIAPATANTLAKMATGICDNLLLASYLSAKCPVVVAPAMDLDMWKHPSTQHNINTLSRHQVRLIPVGNGELASGLVGDGRMAEPEDILAYVEQSMCKADLKGHKIMITAGPTYEAIDPVRFLGNRSTGTMGIALAEAAASRGADVKLVLGPTHLRPKPHPQIEIHSVESAEQMYSQALTVHSDCNISIFAAAVADYKPLNVSLSKLKKQSHDWTIPTTRTPDIAYLLGQRKKKTQIHIGFALETDNEKDNAKRKLEKKNFDFIVLNSLNDKGAGFGHNTNKISIVHKDGVIIDYELKSKCDVAHDILDVLAQRLSQINMDN